jgi:hypothetical protein
VAVVDQQVTQAATEVILHLLIRLQRLLQMAAVRAQDQTVQTVKLLSLAMAEITLLTMEAQTIGTVEAGVLVRRVEESAVRISAVRAAGVVPVVPPR